jgi:hypothetical protein
MAFVIAGIVGLAGLVLHWPVSAIADVALFARCA